MDESMIKIIANSINIAILPVIIIPVVGLCCLVFYNRLAALNNLIHSIYKELISLHTSTGTIADEHRSDLIKTYSVERERLVKRTEMIRTTIICCFAGLIAFILSAISIMITLYWPQLVIVTLTLWLLGAFLFALGLCIGTMEIKSRSLNIITVEATLMEKWLE